MKKYSIILLLTVLSISAKAQAPWQKEKRWVPFVSSGVAYANKELWSALDAGMQNHNTQIYGGTTSYLWEYSKDIAIYIGAAKRIFTIRRLEGWGTASVSNNLKFTPGNYQANFQFKLKLHPDKAVTPFVWAGGSTKINDLYFPALQYGGGLVINFRGWVDRDY